MFKIIPIFILSLLFNIGNANAYMMKDIDDYNSIDRIRSCTTINVGNKYKLQSDTKSQPKIGVIKNEDLLRFGINESIARALDPSTLISDSDSLKKLDYNYRISNEACLRRSIALYLSVKLAIKRVHSQCQVKGIAPSIMPRPINDLLIIQKGMQKISNRNCSLALGGVTIPFVAFFADQHRMAAQARGNMERTRLCGHNWNSWNPDTRDKDQIGRYQRRVKICVECRLGILDQNDCMEKIGDDGDNYKSFCNDDKKDAYDSWKGKAITDLLNYRKYREYIYRGVEREDRYSGDWGLMSFEGSANLISRITSENMRYCIDPTKEYNSAHGDITKAYYIPALKNYKFLDAGQKYEDQGYEDQGYYIGDFAVQKYYYRGTSAPEFNCNKYLQEPKIIVEKDGKINLQEGDKRKNTMRDIYRHAYECCMRKKHGSICVEYASNSDDFLDNLFVDNLDNFLDNNDPTNDYDYHGGDYYVDNGNVTKENYRICNAGSICNFGEVFPLEFDSEYVTTDSGSSMSGDNLLCAHTISLCPFDFNIGGATTICNFADLDDQRVTGDDDSAECGDAYLPTTTTTDEDEEVKPNRCIPRDKIGTCSNYCQMFNHCVVVDRSKNHSNISINSPYFDKACFDFKGESRYHGRSSSWDADILPGNITRLTSPIAQCARETMKNIFFNIAGHSKCEKGYNHGNYSTCTNNKYIWEKGKKLDHITNDEGEKVYFSFFEFLQDKLYIIIQAFLILYVMIFGMKFFMADKAIPRDEILMSCLKLAIVLYFATGQAWQYVFFDLIYYTSITLGNIILDLKNSSLNLIMEGANMAEQAKKCYFNPSDYPKGMGYVAIWDMFDCKLSQYLGLGPGLTGGNLAILIISGFFTGPYGVKFASLLLIFAAMFITIIYVILYTFVIYSATILVLIFISPMMMVALLFKKTKQMIFDNWFRQLMESATQIIILFSFVSLVMFVFDSFFIGSAEFDEYSDTPNCDCYCKSIAGGDRSTKKEFIKNGKKLCSVTDDIAVQMDRGESTYGTSFSEEYLFDRIKTLDQARCNEKFQGNAYYDESDNNSAIIIDERFVINCRNIYEAGFCEQRDGFEIVDPKADSLICIMMEGSLTKNSNLAIFGITVPTLEKLINPDRRKILVLTLIKITLVVYIIQIMTLRIVSISSTLWQTKGIKDLSSVNIGMNNKRKLLTKKLADFQLLASRGVSKVGMKAVRKGKEKMGNGDE